MPDRPTGTVTFLFTDIEGSTKLWEQHPAAMQPAIGRHDALLRQVVQEHAGYVVKSTGDGLHAAFPTAHDACTAAVEAQRALLAEPWSEIGGLQVRMGLHAGAAEERDGDYFGPAVKRAARLMAVAHGGQVLVSQSTADLVRDQLPAEVSLRDLGAHRLKDLVRPEHVYQVVAPNLPADFPALKALDRQPNNLPVQLTAFVGRDRELAEVMRLLATTHLLTLTGSGGTGKTRLSQEVGAQLLDHFADGVWLVELAPVLDPELVVQSVTGALGVREQPGRPLFDVLADYLRYKQLVLILDNCEHLIEACAHLAADLLQACPKLKLLASSREALGIAGEATFSVPSLAVPRVGPGSTGLPAVDELAQYEAVRLFVERARSVLPSFRLTDANAAVVVQICHRLDGIPLAIELAAARARVLAVEQIAARLDDRFRLLTGGSRTALPRQQTLRALIDWSWDLLTDAERALLRRLSAFVGGWTLEASEVVGGDPEPAAPATPPGTHALPSEDVLDVLSQLVNKSLVVVEPETEARYRLLETIRQYARDKLLESGEGADVRSRHLRFYLAYAETARPRLRGPDMLMWLDRLELEHDNLRAALAWAMECDPDAGLRLAGALTDFWGRRTYATEGSRWLQEALDRVAALPPVDGEAGRARMVATAIALQGQAGVAIGLGKHAEAQAASVESVALAREVGDAAALAQGLGLLAMAAAFQGDLDTARAAADEAEVLCRQRGYTWLLGMVFAAHSVIAGASGDPMAAHAANEQCVRLARETGNPWMSAMAIFSSSMIAAHLGDTGQARARLEECAMLFRQMRDRHFVNVTRSELGHLERRLGHYAEAVTLYHESIAGWLELGNRTSLAHELESLAIIAAAEGQPRRAARLFGAADALRQATGSAMTGMERAEYTQAITHARAQMDEPEWQAAWAEGQAMTLEQAVAYALEDTLGE